MTLQLRIKVSQTYTPSSNPLPTAILCHQNIKKILRHQNSLIFLKNTKFPDFSLTGKMPSNFP